MLAVLLIVAKWLGLLGMVAAGVIGFCIGDTVSLRTHYLIGLLSSMLFALAQVMTIYYFVGMRNALRRACTKHGLSDDVAALALTIKRSVSGRGYILSLLATVTMIMAGGALFGRMPAWVHYSLAILTIIGGVYTGAIEFGAFRRNADLFERTAALIDCPPAGESGGE
ncbi:MAG: hypothetical protein HY304_01605 [candidate division Zixibacteria bacterium]|nr:hypothetical protein [candidate division Zixibacteria bacterium]